MKKFEKVFESERIEFIKLSEKLVDEYLLMVNNPEITRLIQYETKVFSLQDELDWIKSKTESKAPCFSMLEKATGEFIGNIEIMNIRDRLGEIGIVITPEKQNMHYGTEAMKAIMEYGREKLNLNSFDLSVMPNNLRAINCYKKLGFVQNRIKENGDIYMLK